MHNRATLGEFLQDALIQLLKQAKGRRSQKQIANALTKLLLEGVKGKLDKSELVAKFIDLIVEHCAAPPGSALGCCCIMIRGLPDSCSTMTRAACSSILSTRFDPIPCPSVSASLRKRKTQVKARA